MKTKEYSNGGHFGIRCMVYRISSIATFTYFQNQIEQPAELIVLCKMRA